MHTICPDNPFPRVYHYVNISSYFSHLKCAITSRTGGVLETDFISPDRIEETIKLFVSFGLKPPLRPGEMGIEIVWPSDSQSTVESSQER